MTDLTPIKTLLAEALCDAADTGFNYGVMHGSSAYLHDDVSGNSDRLATAIHDHFLNREKVRAALIYAFSGPGGDSEMLAEYRADWTVDRLIDSLAGGSR